MSERQKLRVEKRDRWGIGEFWTAFQGEEGWFDNTPQFPTWAEAMAYADERSRTPSQLRALIAQGDGWPESSRVSAPWEVKA